MNPIDLLMEDHRKVEKLFSDFLSTEDDERKEEIFQEIQSELTAHAEAEERAFYPVIKDEAPGKVKESLKEHTAVKDLLVDLLEKDFDDEEFDDLFTELIQNVQDHVREEEAVDGLLEKARQTLSEQQLSRMAQQIIAIKQDVESDLAA
jgi:hemerythrin superfamily protein